MFPGPHDQVIYNDAGEPLGWETVNDDPFDYDNEPEDDDPFDYDDEPEE